VQVVTALLLFVTIIGFPLGIASLRMARIAVAPFGKKIIRESDIEPGMRVFIGAAPA